MVKYFRPIISIERTYPSDAIFLGSTGFWFSLVKVFERGLPPKLVRARTIPVEIKSSLITYQDNILGQKKTSPLLMGILNTSPDSFSGDGAYNNDDIVSDKIDKMCTSGIDIIDIGGESTRPGFSTIPVDEEKDRIKVALKFVRKAYPDTIISIDTRKSLVAEYALSLGAKIFNDVSALSFDSRSIDIAKKFGAYVSLMHSAEDGIELHKKITGTDFLLDIFDYLRKRVSFAESHGISKSKILIDPGIGFGKTEEQNLVILKNISLFHTLGCPILVGVSRKKFVGNIIGEEKPASRMVGSTFLAGELIKQGVQVVRVHDIIETIEVLKLFYSLLSVG